MLPMVGFESQISGVGSDRSTNWATTTAQNLPVCSMLGHLLRIQIYGNSSEIAFATLDKIKSYSLMLLIWDPKLQKALGQCNFNSTGSALHRTWSLQKKLEQVKLIEMFA